MLIARVLKPIYIYHIQFSQLNGYNKNIIHMQLWNFPLRIVEVEVVPGF